jgi:DNA topoisomerase VI subunit B
MRKGDHGKCGVFILVMLKKKELASEVNLTIREVCQRLDESAALVRKESPEEASDYAIAIAKIFETITSEIFVPLYREHSDIAPPIWHEMHESKE